MDLQKACEVLGSRPDSNERDVRRAYRAKLFQLEDEGQSDAGYAFKKSELEEAFAICLEKSKSVQADTSGSILASIPEDPEAVRKKLALRMAVGLFGIAAIVLGFQWVSKALVDVSGDSKINSVGMIAAIETQGSGSKIVVFDPQGKKLEPAGSQANTIDKDPAWRPDGNRLLFVSNRDDGNFNIYRWNPLESKAELRSIGNRAKANLLFGTDPSEVANDEALLTSGGFVLKYDQKTGITTQVLPPPLKNTKGGEGENQGSVSQMEAIYKQIGTSFALAKWGAERKIIWSVMRRESDEVFVMNSLDVQINKGQPLKMLAAKKIEFDVTPAGDVVIILRQFQFTDPENVPKEYLINGVPTAPYDSAVFFVPANGGQPAFICHTKGQELYFGSVQKDEKPIEKLKEGKYTLGYPAIARDGSMVVFATGRLVGESGFQGTGLVAFPLRPDSTLKGPSKLVVGEVSEPSYSSSGDRIVYLKKEADGKRAIYTTESGGGSETKITTSGDYSSPFFSPQLSAK